MSVQGHAVCMAPEASVSGAGRWSRLGILRDRSARYAMASSRAIPPVFVAFIPFSRCPERRTRGPRALGVKRRLDSHIKRHKTSTPQRIHSPSAEHHQAAAARLVELPCADCEGSCCTGHRGVLLDDGSILAFIDGRCPHLSDVGGCRIYATRPRGCRAFDCSQEPAYLRSNPRVAALLTVHGIAFEVLPPIG